MPFGREERNDPRWGANPAFQLEQAAILDWLADELRAGRMTCRFPIVYGATYPGRPYLLRVEYDHHDQSYDGPTPASIERMERHTGGATGDSPTMEQQAETREHFRSRYAR